MVQEVRSILFTADEIRGAVTDLLAARVKGLRAKQVVRVELEVSGGAVRALVHFGAGLDTTRVLEGGELMSAVLLFCKRSRIPLSSRSHKRLGVIGGCLTLTASINLAAAAPRVDGNRVTHAQSGPDLTALHIA